MKKNISAIEAKIEKKKEEIKSLKEQLAALQSKKAQNDYQELLDYMKNNNLSACPISAQFIHHFFVIANSYFKFPYVFFNCVFKWMSSLPF